MLVLTKEVCVFFLGWSSTLLKRDLRQGCTFREETFVVNCVYSNLADKGTNTYEIQVIEIAEKVSALVLLLLFFDMIYCIMLSFYAPNQGSCLEV